MARLAINGGEPVRTKAWPSWPIRGKREEELLLEVCRSGDWAAANRPMEAEFAEKFAGFSRAKYAVCLMNGTVALQLALEALDIGAGDEVIVPGYTWQATAAACLDVNAIPIIVDVDPETYCIDPALVEAAITPRTRAIIPVHLYGSMADMDRIMEIARKHGLKVIEDCAQTHGSRWREMGAGVIGDVGSFSMQHSKVLTSGEGGAAITNDDNLYDRLCALRHCGRPRQGEKSPIQSGNYRMTEFQAAVLLAGMERLEDQVNLRDENAQYLSKRLAEIPGIKPMKRHPQITRQSYFSYAFRYDPSGFKGAPRSAFLKALAAEIGLAPWIIFEPLNRATLYNPQTKKRHHWSQEYWQAIDPSHFELPVCDKAHREECCAFHHPFLLGSKADMDDFADGASKVQENAGELSEV
jgi:L-glutamine:2-deoxy-scyllo-inosose/3-amino-2,3-dideoxy-scyllo-inosose aminotransferase